MQLLPAAKNCADSPCCCCAADQGARCVLRDPGSQRHAPRVHAAGCGSPTVRAAACEVTAHASITFGMKLRTHGQTYVLREHSSLACIGLHGILFAVRRLREARCMQAHQGPHGGRGLGRARGRHGQHLRPMAGQQCQRRCAHMPMLALPTRSSAKPRQPFGCPHGAAQSVSYSQQVAACAR